jgi:formate-dependent nitrite reductase membrane component NrfD
MHNDEFFSHQPSHMRLLSVCLLYSRLCVACLLAADSYIATIGYTIMKVTHIRILLFIDNIQTTPFRGFDISVIY